MKFKENLLRSWLDFIDLEDKASAEIDVKNVSQGFLADLNRSIELNGNQLRISNRAVFEQVKKRIKNKKNTDKDRLSLSFPYIRISTKGESKLKPFFVIDVEDIFTSDYRQSGWDLTEFEFDPSSINIRDILQLDDEELDHIYAGPNLIDFINETFSTKGYSLEEVSSQLIDKYSNNTSYGRNAVFKSKPYVFEYQGEGFNRNLKRDLNYILKKQRAELDNKQNLLTAYMSDKNYSEKKLFYGALGEHLPTDSQAQVIYSSVNNRIIAAQGPPGSGKTTLILNIVANQVVKGVISLIRDKKDVNCLTVIASTNNRAVDNAVEKLMELQNEKKEMPLCLEGGNQEKIRRCAITAIKKRIDTLNNLEFNEESYNRLAEQVMQTYNGIKRETEKFNSLISRVKEYRNQIDEKRTQQEAYSEKCKQLQEELTCKSMDYFGTQMVEQDFLEVNPANYHRIHDLLVKYCQSFPRLFDWFHWRSRRHINKLNVELEELVGQTYCNVRELRVGLVQDEKDLLVLKDRVIKVIRLIGVAEDLQRTKTKVDELESDLKRLEHEQSEQKEKIRQWLKSAAQGELKLHEVVERCFDKMTFEYEDIYTFYHKLFFKENMSLFGLCQDFLLQYILKDKTRYVDVLEKYAKLLAGRDTRGLYKDVLLDVEGFYRSLSKVFPVFSCTLQSVSNMFMYTCPNLIDKVIIDEAGMVKCYQVAPLFFRANSAVVVGDPLQIPPVITHGKQVLEDYETNMFLKGFLKDNKVSKDTLDGYISSYSPSSERATAYYMAATCKFGAADSDEKLHELQLKEHFRCQKDIAEYFNSICGYGLKVLTPEKQSCLGTNLVASHVEGKMKGKANVDEINAVKLIISYLKEQGYSIEGPPDSGIGVITPYRVHCQMLKRELEREFKEFKTEENRIGTIHTFQGGEKDVIICSTKIFSETHSGIFINKWPNLLNVAVSRAKELFVLVGNLDKLRSSGDYTKQLVDHIEAKGKILDINDLSGFARDKL